MTDDAPHRRRNPLNDSWVLVSPHRTKRPWQGQVEAPEPNTTPAYVEDCYLCPGNTRAGGVQNPDYDGVWVFDNDFPALLDAGGAPVDDPLLGRAPVAGTCRVICYSPSHNLTMSTLPVAALRDVVDAWAAQHAELSARYDWVQIFENRGAMMGCSNPHPHGQIWATDTVPTEAAKKRETQRAWHATHGTAMLADYATREVAEGERVLIDTPHWLVVVPWWAVWPFETLIIARDDVAGIDALSDAARDDLARVLSQLTRGYDALFSAPFPYSMGWSSAPAGAAPGWRLHAHFYPPLLRSATVRKFMVGYELMAEAQRDLTPEQAAERLRAVIPTEATA